MGLLTCHQERGGVVLPALDLWLDPTEARKGPERVFVSHAHSDHTARHREVILTGTTARLMRARLSGERTEHRLAWRVPTSFAHRGLDWRITLLPAGHILGSAMALVEAEGESLLFTGDFKLRPGLSAEPCEPVRAGTLVMETTFGRPKYVFPPVSEVLDDVVRFCRETLGNHEVPVLLGYSLGKSQEVLVGLGRAGLPVAVHPQVARLSDVYRECGQALPDLVLATPGSGSGRVVVCPPGTDLARFLGPDTPVRKAVLTGWALDGGCSYRYGADVAFPLSDHADFEELIEFVRRVEPRKVLTMHGFAADFAAVLRDLGYDARALGDREQLTFQLGPRTAPPTNKKPGCATAEMARPDRDAEGGVESGVASDPRSFDALSRALEAIGWCSDPAEKAHRLEGWLRQLPPALVSRLTAWIAGGPLVPPDLVREAVCRAAGVAKAEFTRLVARRGGEPGAAAELMDRLAPGPLRLTVDSVAEGVGRLVSSAGRQAQVSELAALLRVCRAGEARCLVRLLGGDLRTGLSEAALEEVLARLAGCPLADLRRASALVGGLSGAVESAFAGRLGEVAIRPFRPVRSMVSKIVESAPDCLDPGGGGPCSGEQELWVEDWPGGFPCHLHRLGSDCRWFDAGRGEFSPGLPALTREVVSLPVDVVLEGELVAGGEAGPGSGGPGSAARCGRDAEPDLFGSPDSGMQFVVLDLLWAGGRDWTDRPWFERRSKLEEIIAGRIGEHRRLILVAGRRVSQPGGWADGLRAAQLRGQRGLTVRRLAAPYLPGSEGGAWRIAVRSGAP